MPGSKGRRRLVGPLLLIVAALVASACGTQTGPGGAGPSPDAGRADLPITQRAIAAVALEHLPEDTTKRAAASTDKRDPRGALGADLRYDGDGEYDGDLVRIFVNPSQEEDDLCSSGTSAGCEVREVDGGTLVLIWELEVFESDPGYVVVALQREDETVSVLMAGDVITRDPRTMDLSIPVEDLEAVATDERISLTTTQGVLDQGEALEEWEGGEPDPNAHDRVPSTDEGIYHSYLQWHGGYSYYSEPRTSPLTADFGADAIGSRFDFDEGPDRLLTIDVLASRDGPPWLQGDPCTAYPGGCSAESKDRYVLWTPGLDGEIWYVAKRPEDVVALRITGLDVGSSARRVKVQGDWSLEREFLLRDTVGVTTDREILDFDPEPPA